VAGSSATKEETGSGSLFLLFLFSFSFSFLLSCERTSAFWAEFFAFVAVVFTVLGVLDRLSSSGGSFLVGTDIAVAVVDTGGSFTEESVLVLGILLLVGVVGITLTERAACRRCSRRFIHGFSGRVGAGCGSAEARADSEGESSMSVRTSDGI